ncbi:MAG TPA: hypothetical protein VMI10_04620 [Terriglobales bacterium]|nr:hypothetical protein [Terriglobales bacterium]
MRTLFSLLLFACLTAGLSGIALAQDAANRGNRDSENLAADLQAAPVTGDTADRAVLRFGPDASEAGDRACAYMRTYRVKRHRRGWDVVGPAGYTTCVPMRRFEMRSAVERRDGTVQREY